MSGRKNARRAKAVKPKRYAIAVITLESAMLEHLVRHARHEITIGGERLAELGESLQEIGGVALSSGPAELRRAGVRAQADCTQAIVGVVNAMMSAERIALLANLREQVGPEVENGGSDG